MNYISNRPEGHPQMEAEIMRLLDSGRDFGAGRVPTIYIENHDHTRFMLKAGPGRSSWYLTQPYIIALFTSPDSTLIYNGQEFGVYDDIPDQGNGRVVPRPLDWNLLTSEPGPTVFNRYQQMMRIRRDYAGLRTSNSTLRTGMVGESGVTSAALASTEPTTWWCITAGTVTARGTQRGSTWC